MSGLKTASQILDKKYGVRGTPVRNKFTKEAYSYYLSEILKQRRKELKMTQEELATKLGKKRPYISRVENGEDVRLSNFVQIARVLGLGFDLRPI